MWKFLALTLLIVAVKGTHVGYLPPTAVHHTQQIPHQEPARISQTHNDEGYVKHFYYFNAPEEHIEHREPVKKITTKTKKNLQVIFIKPPEEKHHEKAVLNLAKNAIEEKTHIYVLNKEPNHAAITKKTQTIHQQTSVHHHHKPEVHFVKYKTPADAQRIQETIVQQYGGKLSDIIHLDSAPIQNGDKKQQIHHESKTISREYLVPPLVDASLKVDNNYAKNFLPTGVDVKPGTSYIPPALRF